MEARILGHEEAEPAVPSINWIARFSNCLAHAVVRCWVEPMDMPHTRA